MPIVRIATAWFEKHLQQAVPNFKDVTPVYHPVITGLLILLWNLHLYGAIWNSLVAQTM